MKKLYLTLCILVLFSIGAFAVGTGMGIRYIAMGGTGVALANDLNAAYFNPAGLMYGPENFESIGYLGGSATNLDKLAAALSGPNFITDNFGKELIASASLKGGLGMSIKKVGFCILAEGGPFSFNKPANSLNVDIRGELTEQFPITMGSTFPTQWFPEVAFGVNIKPIMQQSILTSVVSAGATGTGTQKLTTGSGFGFDIGAMAKITPVITGGIMIRNISSSINNTVKTTSLTVYPTGTVESGAEISSSGSGSLPMEICLGVAGIIPTTGTVLAADIDNYSAGGSSYMDLHFGVEQKVLFNMLSLRMGYFTDGPSKDSYLTWGGELSLGVNIGFACVNSTKDSANSIVQFGMSSTF